MRVLLKCLECIHLDQMYQSLTIQNSLTVMALYGFLDCHAYFSLNDMQFWSFMHRVTDMDTKTIKKFFWLLDYDYTGEMNYCEFYLLVACMIAAKDKLEKEFLQRHLKRLCDILDWSEHKYLSISEFVMLGSLMGWNYSSVERLYKSWDRSMENERYRIYIDKMKFLAVCLIDDERALDAKNRIRALSDFHTRYLLNIKKWIQFWNYYEALPPPSDFYKSMMKVEPPWVPKKNLYGKSKSICKSFFKWIFIIVLFPLWAFYKISAAAYKHGKEYKKANKIGSLKCSCEWFWKCWRKTFFELCISDADNPNKVQIPLNSLLYYNKNRHKIRNGPTFKYFDKKRQGGEMGDVDPWTDPWLLEQLHLEKIERQILANRKKIRSKKGLKVMDVASYYSTLEEQYLTGTKRRRKFVQKPKRLLSRKSLTGLKPHAVSRYNLEGSEYPKEFLTKYDMDEIKIALRDLRISEGPKGRGHRYDLDG